MSLPHSVQTGTPQPAEAVFLSESCQRFAVASPVETTVSAASQGERGRKRYWKASVPTRLARDKRCPKRLESTRPMRCRGGLGWGHGTIPSRNQQCRVVRPLILAAHTGFVRYLGTCVSPGATTSPVSGRFSPTAWKAHPHRPPDCSFSRHRPQHPSPRSSKRRDGASQEGGLGRKVLKEEHHRCGRLHCCKRSSILPGQSQIPPKWKKKKCCFLRVRGETAGSRVPRTQPICRHSIPSPPARKARELPGLLLDVP